MFLRGQKSKILLKWQIFVIFFTSDLGGQVGGGEPPTRRGKSQHPLPFGVTTDLLYCIMSLSRGSVTPTQN